MTRSDLRVPDAQRLFRGVYVSADVEVDVVVRARAALLVHPTGVIGGVAAAAVWGSAHRTTEAEVDVYVRTAGARSQHGLRARRDRLRPDEIATVDDVPVTTPARTALDLARRLPLVEAVAAVDALCRATGLHPEEVEAVADARTGARDVRTVARVLALVDVRAGSPPWSRARVVLVERGVPRPEVGVLVRELDAASVQVLELAWPAVRYGVGPPPTGPSDAQPDLDGWRVERVDPIAAVVAPDRFAAAVLRALRRAGRRG